MTEYGLPFDGLLLGDATKAPYSAAEWARAWKLMHGLGVSFPNYGVFKGSGDGTNEPLAVLADSPVSANVKVQIGAAMIDGRFYETPAIVSQTINANASGNARIDTIILRLDYTLQTVRLAVKQGTPAASPARPTLQQDATFWEIPLADVAVANGFTTLAQSTITQRQRDVLTAARGWMPYAYGVNHVINANYDAATISLGSGLGTNLPAMAIPFALPANLLLDGVAVRLQLDYSFSWDIYTQDVNDGNTAENTLRKIATSNGNASAAIGGNATVSLAPEGGTCVLVPGMYWVVIENRHATLALNVRALATNTFTPNIYQTKALTLVTPSALDFVTGWTKQNSSIPGVRLNGRIFGQTAAY